MHDNSKHVKIRIERFMIERLKPSLYIEKVPVQVAMWSVPDEPVPVFEALEQEFTPVEIGANWGHAWGTDWFSVTGRIPEGWKMTNSRIELIVDLGFTTRMPGFQAEGLAYDEKGRVIKGIEPHNQHIPLDSVSNSEFKVYIEAAGNPDIWLGYKFQPTLLGNKDTAGKEKLYRLGKIELALRDESVWQLMQDFRTLKSLLDELSPSEPRHGSILRSLERAIDVMDPQNISGSAEAGREILAQVLKNPAVTSAHRIHAVGHAHIDSAWLWPIRETVRKVARTFSNVMSLMDEHPDFHFAASSAQQYLWLKNSQPELFERLKTYIARGQFIPTGGMWVEADTNMPGGESLARQFIEGKRYFLDEFGIETTDAWLPDSFGYSAALPQIVRAAGSQWMLTQKLSWNETNRMPHHTFLWEGIDGTQLFTHFPPVDTYNSDLGGADLARAQRQYSEKGLANTSLVPFGWGDGGGGPTREMVAAALRTASLEGSPTVILSTPENFYKAALEEYQKPPVWSGELYLEFHRGTYTSQARTKRGNRRSEHLLREAELWASHATILRGVEYPREKIRDLWREVLLLQFHDILPGSSISWVHQEAEASYEKIRIELEELITQSLSALAGQGDTKIKFNAGPFECDGIEAMSSIPLSHFVESTSATYVEEFLILQNSKIKVAINGNGLINSIYDLVVEREVVPRGMFANVLQLFRDTPNQWDAWDIDDHYKRDLVELTELDSIEIIDLGDSGPRVKITRFFGQSAITQIISLRPNESAIDIETTVDWHERQKLLKLSIPVEIHADRAASEIQFGHIYRPTHANTSWDAARFETVAHRWVHVEEPGYGVSVANDSTYGHDISREVGSEGAISRIRLSLLRAPIFPDPDSDQGVHTMKISIRVGSGIPDAIKDGYRINLPNRSVFGNDSVKPLFSLNNSAVVIESLKLADDNSGDVILRLYEAYGTRTLARLESTFEIGHIVETDLLEREIDGVSSRAVNGAVELKFRPFQILTLRITLTPDIVSNLASN